MKSIRNILFKVVAWCFFAVLALFSAAVLVIKLPSVQTYIIQKATTFVSSRTNTKVRIKEVAIVFPTSIRLLEVYAEDQNKDTLVFLGKLDVAVNLFSLFKKEINLSRTEIYDLNAKIYRPANDSIFNFQFIINAFAKSSAKPEEETPKDTISTNTPWTFYAGEFQLRNVKLAFADSLVGNLFYCKVSNLSLEIEELDLEMMRFKLNSLQIVNAQSSFEITKSSPASTVTGKAVPLNITLNKLAFENVNFRFTNKPENQNMSFQLGKSQIRNAFFDLPSLQAKVGRFDLSNSKIDISMQIDNSIITKIGDKVTFDLPKNNRFGIEVETINLQRNDLKLDLDNKKRKPKGVDFQHLAISNINLSAKKSHYRFQNMSAKIESFSAVEIGGLMIRNFATDFVMDSIHAEAKNLYLETQFSKISHYAAIGFDSWDGLSENIANLKIKADLHETVIDAKDIVQLQPDLINIDFINRNMSRAVKMDASIKGQLQDISIEKLRVEIGKNTMLVAKGNITGLPKISTTKFDILLTYLLTSKEDINTFLPSTLLSAIQLPDTMYANGSFLGTIYNFYAKVIAKTTDGYFNGKITIADLDKRPIYKANLEAKSLNIGKILRQKPLLGKATLAANVSGKGFSIEDMDVIVDAKIDSVFLHKYNYTKIEVKGNIKDKLFNGFAAINDPNLNLNFEGKVNMNQKINDYNFRLDILGADLQNLQLSNKDIRLSAQANANIKAPTFDKMNGKASIRNIVLYSNGKKYEVDSLLFVSFNDDKNSRMDVNSAIFKAKFNGNMPIFSLPTVLSNHFNYYFDTVKVKSRKPENFDFELDITNSPLIYEVIVPKLKDFVPGKVKGSFDSETHKLDFDASFISVDFAGNRLKNFNAGIHSNSQSLDYALGLDMFSNSQIFLEKTKLSGSVSKNIASIDVSIQGKDKKNKLNIASELAMLKGGIFSYSILPKGLMINDENWSIPEKNYIEFSNKGLYIVNMDLENGNQKMSINSTSKSAEADLNITFNQFQLINFSKMLEKTDPIARGKLDGTINFKNYNRQMAFVSDLLIEKTQYRHNDIGNISLKADNLVDKKYTISAIISGNENDIQLDGYLQSQAKSMDLNLDVRLKSLNLSAFQGFVDQQATKISGIATGNIKVGGNTALPEINGEISLSKVGGEITFLNQYLTIDEGKISIDPDGVYFPHFVVKDAQNNAAIITGSIGMRALQNFRYNIVVLTDNFTVMNSTRKNNKMLNGKMIVSSNIRIRGEALKPDIEATVKLVDGSNICFTVPESQLSADKGEGIVEFDVDTISLNPIIRKALLQKKVSSDVKGVHIISNIELNKRSTLKLVLDPTQADTLIVRGDANLSFAPDESGKMSLTGTYVVDNGSYELSLQDIVKKKFFISRGSTIIWNGDPLDALVDITAQHNVKTSPADLLASSAGGKVGVDRNTTKNALNFFVKIFMKGALLKPNLKFGLDMEPSQQQAFGGTVYAKINALNASESELNKQVFSLLVLGTFMPTSNTFGNGADYNGIARSSASSILSSQLNALSAQYIKGVEVNFDLQSYNDYASGQKTGNTQLSVGVKKQFFDDKLSVQIGSNIGLEGQKSSQNNLSNFTGNIVMEYKLTKDGNYRLKAFRQNQYEGLIYGVVVKTGAGIIYSRDYDIFGELFKNRDRIGR